MTFREIIEAWRTLPRHPDTGKPIRASVAMRDFIRTLTASDERGWFKACHAWHRGGPAPDGYQEIDDILDCLTPFQRNMAHAHLDCARLVRCPCDEAFALEIKSVAEKRKLPELFLLELAQEIRCGQPRQPVAPPAYITCPLVWKERGIGVLARFVLEKLSDEERLLGTEGRVFPAPAQFFFIGMDEQFQDTFTTALAAVRESFDIAPAASRSRPLEDIRVSIEPFGRGTRPAVIRLEGSSASAALALSVAKCWIDGNEEVDGKGLESNNSPLRHLDLRSIAITAGVTPKGCLYGVGGVHLKALEILLTREAQSHEINVLVVAQDQAHLFGTDDQGPKSQSFLWPKGDSTPKNLTSDEVLRSPESLLVIHADNLSTAAGTLDALQANTLLSVLEKPFLVGAYLLAGSRWFAPALVALIFAGWYFLPALWFVLIGAAWVAAGITFVRSKIKKIKRRAEVCILPQRASYSPQTWADMAETLEARQSARSFTNLCHWFKTLLSKTSDERLTLRFLPWLWCGSKSFWFRLLILALPLALLFTPLQDCLAEHLFPGTANILRGESRRGDGNNVRYAPIESECGSGLCVHRATIGSYGLIRLFLEHKARTSRFLRVTCVDTMSYVKVDDDGPGSKQIIVPVINDEAKFYYGIDENTPWEIELDVEVLCRCNTSLSNARFTGDRAPPRE